MLDRLRDIGCHLNPIFGERWWLLAEDGDHGLGGGVPLECPFPGEHLVEHAAEGEDVGAMVGRLTSHLFGRHVAHRSHHSSLVGQRRLD